MTTNNNIQSHEISWDYLVTRGYITNSSVWAERQKNIALKIAEGDIMYFKDNYSDAEIRCWSYALEYEIMKCDMVMIAISHTNNRELIQMIIDQYIGSNTEYNIKDHVKQDNYFFKYKHLFQHIINDYDRLNKVIRKGMMGQFIFADAYTKMCETIRSKINPLMLNDDYRPWIFPDF